MQAILWKAGLVVRKKVQFVVSPKSSKVVVSSSSLQTSLVGPFEGGADGIGVGAVVEGAPVGIPLG